MNRFKFTVTALTLAAAMIAGSSEARADFECKDIVYNKRDPIAFKPFPLQHPKTGQKYLPNEEIEVAPGKKMLASQFFDQINDLEQKLNAWGYTLRESGAFTLQDLDECLALLQKQKEAIEKDLDKNPPKPWDLEARKKALEAKWQRYRDKIPTYDELAHKANSDAVKVNLPNPPPFTTPVPQAARVQPKDVMKRRTWNFEEGSKKTFWVAGEASVGIKGSREITAADAYGKFFAGFLGLWDGEVASASALAQSGKDIDTSLKLEVRLVGQTIWSPKFEGGQTKFLHHNDRKSWGVDKGLEWRFAIGPVPCKGRVGFRGEAGVGYGFDIAPTAVGGFAGPFAKADAYAQVGVDIGIAGAGVEADLVLIDDQLTLKGDASFEFVDQPKLELDLSASNKLSALSGKFSAYAYIDYLIDEWRGNWTIWSWEGFNKTWDIFHFKYVWTPTGVRADGDVTAEDVMEIQAQNQELRLVEMENKSNARLHEVMKAAAEDMNGPKATQVLTERARVASLAQGIDGNITTYLQELRKWITS
ncbi:hypothetical protein [Pendulispora albinea]|uniref:Uncharacterized protein n=1 Tax=Pendulispora albinea TaxID=2741071 RepID=A0ABZ2M2N9_9BACT